MVLGAGLVDNCVTVQSTRLFPVLASRTFVRFTVATESVVASPKIIFFGGGGGTYSGRSIRGEGFRRQCVPPKRVKILL
jgi:hypothetical protein